MPLCFTFFLTPNDSCAHMRQSNRPPRYSMAPSGLRLERSSAASASAAPEAAVGGAGRFDMSCSSMCTQHGCVL